MAKLGKDCKFYWGSSLLSDTETPGTLSWQEIQNVRDVNLNLETGEADATSRKSNGWRQTLTTFKDGSIEFELLWEPGDAAFDALRAAWQGSSEIALMALDDDAQVSGSQGLASNFRVPNFSRSEPLEGTVTASVTVKPSSQTDWYEVP